MTLFQKLLSVITLFALTSSVSDAADTITVGSKNFTESIILGEIMAQLIESRTSLVVKRKKNLGTAIAVKALETGDIDLYPDYTGTGWYVHLSLPKQKLTALEAFTKVKRLSKERFDFIWLDPFGFSNGYAFALRKDRAKVLGVKSISDLKKHQNSVTVAVTHEFLNREDGMPEVTRAYGLKLKNLRESIMGSHIKQSTKEKSISLTLILRTES